MTNEHRRAAVEAACRIHVTGFVQGVGFRPYCVRLARKLSLHGAVYNSFEGVVIHLEGARQAIDQFVRELRKHPPSMARVEGLAVRPAAPQGYDSFGSQPSRTSAPPLVRVPPDLPTCRACLDELFDPANRRYRYPFITCTECGPRYTILEELPYDRHRTAMRLFPACDACSAEYNDLHDRRYHSETNSCPSCGPQVEFRVGERLDRRLVQGDDAIRKAVELVRQGGILALKGLGGYQLICLADSSIPVRRLRERKRRPVKPFAVMVPGLEWLIERCRLPRWLRELLADPANAIVLIPRSDELERGSGIVPEVAPRSPYLGLFLPTTPVHHLLLRELARPLVATSGNVTEDPIVSTESELERLASIADAALIHNRAVVHRADDSVVLGRATGSITIRVGRGIGPLPLPSVERWLARRNVPPGLAVGGHQKVALALWTGQQAILGLHIGDMATASARAEFEAAVNRLQQLYQCTPRWFAADLHPDYYTARWARQQCQPLFLVQHHYAHALAAMAEHERLEDLALVAAWDGTGYGTDGAIWGSEVLLADAREFQRVACLWPFRLPGGEAAVREPWRVALGLLNGLEPNLPADELARRSASFLRLPAARCRQLLEVVRRGVNCPETTSMGRLFDAVASVLLGIDMATYEGEPAVALEAAARRAGGSPVQLALPVREGRPMWLDWRPLFEQLLRLRERTSAEELAFAFHAALAAALARCVELSGQQDVLLAGGCFQNGLLVELVEDACRNRGLAAVAPRSIPPGDGGLAAGQLVHAAACMSHE